MKNKIIFIIPARGGSKSIKLKNLQLLDKKPLIYYPINAAIKSGVCDKIIVSTDNVKIANKAKLYGAEVPFLRNKKFSGDLISTEETLKHALFQAESFYNCKFDICVFLTCTNPFRKISWIKYAVNYLKKNNDYYSVFSVQNLYRHFWRIKKNKPSKVLSWMKNYTSRQIAPVVQRGHILACATRQNFGEKEKRIGQKVHFIVNRDL